MVALELDLVLQQYLLEPRDRYWAQDDYHQHLQVLYAVYDHVLNHHYHPVKQWDYIGINDNDCSLASRIVYKTVFSCSVCILFLPFSSFGKVSVFLLFAQLSVSDVD